MEFEEMEPSDAELFVVERASRGEAADLRELNPSGRLPVRAAVLRALLVVPPRSSSLAGVARPATAIRLRWATIAGGLDLADCRGPGDGPLPGLDLEDCALEGPLVLRSTRIARLSLVRCALPLLDGQNCRIDGPLDLSFVRGAGSECFVTFREAAIGGTVLAERADWRAPPAREAFAAWERARYALSFSGATIKGDVILIGCRARGGVSLGNTRVEGDVWIFRSQFSAREGHAFNAQGADLRGMLAIREGSVFLGTVSLLGCRIGRDLEFSTVRLRPRFGRDEFALLASGVSVGASLQFLNKSRLFGPVDLTNCSVGADLSFSHCWVGRQRGFIVNCNSASIARDLHISDVVCVGGFSFRSSRIEREFLCFNTEISQWPEAIGVPMPFAPGLHTALDCEDLYVGHRVQIAGETPFQRVETVGEVSFRNARIGGDFECHGARLNNRSKNGIWSGLNASGIKVGGSFLLRATLIFGSLRMDGARIAAQLVLGRVFIRNGEFVALDAGRAHVSGNVEISICEARGDVDFSSCVVEGRFSWYFLDVRGSGRPGHAPTLDLSDVRIAASLMADMLNNRYHDALRICLRGARVHRLQDSVTGWGRDTALDLVDFSYNTLGSTESAPSQVALGSGFAARWGRSVWRGPGACWRWWRRGGRHGTLPRRSMLERATRRCRARNLRVARTQSDGITLQRLRWLRRQDRIAETQFNPQPYRQLARVLRVQGSEDSARVIAIEGYWRGSPQSRLRRVGYAAFGCGFGFGLSIRLATVTLLATLACGILITEVASRSAMLVDSAAPAASAIPTRAHRCSRISLLYAADMMLPVIQLHQDTACAVAPRPRVTSEVWQIVFAAYRFFGKLAASLAFLTFSGVLRRLD